MNERIKQLVDQCWEEDGIGPADFNPEKFARMIVQECITVVEGLQPGYTDYRSQIEKGMQTFCVSQLKRHFEV